jgi:hypothetical protein
MLKTRGLSAGRDIYRATPAVTLGFGFFVLIGIVLEPPITPVPPRGNFQSYDFLKACEKCYKMRLVCTLAVGALRRFWVK